MMKTNEPSSDIKKKKAGIGSQCVSSKRKRLGEKKKKDEKWSWGRKRQKRREET